LSNLQGGKAPLLQIILVGQSELQTKIANPALASFSQRIGVRYHLRPLTRQETIQYISHRIRKVGGSPDLFTKKAIDLIFATAGGIPRTINLLCDHSFVYGFVDELITIGDVTVKKVIEDFNVHPLGRPTSSEDQSRSFAAGASPSMQQTPGLENASYHDQENLEARLASIERLVNSYFKELHSQFKSQLINERLRTDKLLMAYTRLKLKLDILKGRGDSSNHNAKEQTKKGQTAETKTSKPVRMT
jgi:general secretion pathway protein A